MMPIGTARTSISRIASKASSSERCRAGNIISDTGRPVRSEMPKSPPSVADSQSQYCSQMGRSSPSRSRTAARASSVAFSPSIIWAASPGSTWVMPNTITDTAKRVNRMKPIRLTR